jgi:hypothetical protein
MKNNILLTQFLIFITLSVSAQVAGISGSKLDAVCVDVVDHHKIEFEPGIFHFSSHQHWDENGKLSDIYQSSDSINTSTGMAFRFTYGLWDRFEIGTSILTDLSISNWGMRFVLFNKKKYGMALIAGANIPFGNKTYDRSLRLSQDLISVGGGVVGSFYFNQKISIYMNDQYQSNVGKTAEGNKGSWYINADVGYYLFSNQLQLITGFGYQISEFETLRNSILTFYPGVTIETGKNYIIVLSTPFDIYGVNADKVHGINLALTLTFD